MRAHQPYPPSLRRDERGQVLPIAALSLLAVALSIFSVLSMVRATHEKIRLQNYADSEAYSLAVEEARSYNYYAYSNRAIAATFVQVATLHSYISMAAMMADSDMAMGIIMFEISAEEFAECCCGPFGAPICVEHCWHSIEAAINGALYMVDWLGNTAGGHVGQIDSDFESVVKDLLSHAKLLYETQVTLTGIMAGMLFTGIDSVKQASTNQGGKGSLQDVGTGSLEAGITLLNWMTYSKTINNGADAIPPGDTKTGISKKYKQIIMSNVANASRPPFTWDRVSPVGNENPEMMGMTLSGLDLGVVGPTLDWLQNQATMDSGDFNITLVMESPGDVGFMSNGRTAFVDSNGDFPGIGLGAMSDDANNTSTGTSVHSYDTGFMMSSWHDGAGMMVLPLLSFIGPGEVETGKQNNKHQVDNGWLPFGNPHNGNNHDQAISLQDFTEFNIKSAEGKHWGQPAVYAAAKSDMRTNDQNGAVRPWEITGDSTVTNPWGSGSVTLADTSQGYALSKGMVYYHRFGDWQDDPSFWNPYWRAKLESFDSIKDYTEALTASLNPNLVHDIATVTAICEAQRGIGAVEGGKGSENPPFNMKKCE